MSKANILTQSVETAGFDKYINRYFKGDYDAYYQFKNSSLTPAMQNEILDLVPDVAEEFEEQTGFSLPQTTQALADYGDAIIYFDDELPVSGLGDTGWISANSFTDTNSAWTGETDAYTSNDVYAEGVKSGSSAAYLYFGFDLSSVSDAYTIQGVEISLDGYRATRNPYYVQKTFSIGLGSHGANNDNRRFLNTDWPIAEGTIGSGSSSDKWGLPLTPAYVKDATFTALVACAGALTGAVNYYIDWMRIKVHYTT